MLKQNMGDVLQCPRWQRCGRVNGTVASAILVIVFLYFTATLNVIIPYYNYSVYGAAHLLILSFNTAMGFYCYLACVFVDPGRVPKGWQPELEEQDASHALHEVKRGGGRRYCSKCEEFKPPRTHHCRRCQRCVLRMDHHCIWVNNCIGHGNHRVFLLMCCYLTAAAVHATGLLYCYDAHLLSVLGRQWFVSPGRTRSPAAAAAMRKLPGGGRLDTAAVDADVAGAAGRVEWEAAFWVHAVAQVLGTTLGLPVCVSLVVLLVWNTHLLLRNQTTVEHYEGVRLELLRRGASGLPTTTTTSGGSDGGNASRAAGAAAAALAGVMVVETSGGRGLAASRLPSSQQLDQQGTAAAGAATAGPSAAQLQQQQAQRGAGQAVPGALQPSQKQQTKAAPLRRRHKDADHPYDLGWLRNVQAVCGEWEALWWLPVRHAAAHDGLGFPTSEDVQRK